MTTITKLGVFLMGSFVCFSLNTIIFVVCLLTVYRGYSITGRFNQTTCLVYNITYQGKTQCLTDQRKRDYYDCYTILVKHNTNNVTKETRISGMLHSSGVKVVMHNNAECSHDGCNTPNVHSSESVEQFVKRYRSNLKNNETFQCYFDSKNPSIVLEGIKYGQASALHSFLWPLCFMIMFFTLFCIFGSVSKRRGDKKMKEPDEMPDILLNLKEQVEI